MRRWPAVLEAQLRDGEYRYLSEFLHPAWGAFVGWTSVIVGFAAPVAANAYAASAFLQELVPALPVLPAAAAIVLVFTLAATGRLILAKGTQDALVLVKLGLVSAFVILGLVRGHHAWPAQAAAEPGQSTLSPFVMNLFYAAYAYSGWNAAAYVASAFRSPKRTVPLAMAGATLLTTGFYLLMAHVFIANLGSDDLGRWTENRVTVAHLLVTKLAGPRAAVVASLGIVLILGSCISAMMLAGPSVTSVMARDGFLPRWLAGDEIAAQGERRVVAGRARAGPPADVVVREAHGRDGRGAHRQLGALCAARASARGSPPAPAASPPRRASRP